MTALLAWLGAAVAGGLLLIAAGLFPRAAPAAPRPSRRRRAPLPPGRLAAAAGAAVVVAVVTRWPVGAVLAAVAAYLLPAVLGPDRAHRATIERVEAVAAWAEDLAATLRSAAGIEQAIVQTATTAGPALRADLGRLAQAIGAGMRLPQALRRFADDVNDPTVDMVVHVLLQAAQSQAREVAASLSGVGVAARRQASVRMRVLAGRARTKAATRIVTTVVLGVAVLLTVFAADFLDPYRTPLGQLILAVLGGGFGAALGWMTRIGRIDDLPRILTRRASDVAEWEATR
jgi:Flp pilus assembly protein TadB